MNKKLLAVAVAGALAIPSAAFAASSVTITGFFKLSYVNIKVKPQANGKTSEDRVQDESSRIIFRVVEDLGGGLQAIGQVDWRIALDSGGDGASGANWVGLRSKSWGEIGIGRYDLHYVYTEDQSYSRGGSLKMTNHGIIAFAGGGGTAIANASRTPNVIRWFSPNWNGFTAVVAYSTSPYGTENDIKSTQSKGSAWNIAPQYNAKNWGIGYSYWKAKSDAISTATGVSVTTCTAAGVPAAGVPVCAAAGQPTLVATAATISQIETRGDRVNAHYQWKGLRIGLVWDKAKITNEVTNTETSKRDAWSVPVRYDFGKHSIFGHYSWAKDDKQINGGNNSGAKMFAIGYAYSLSKRTKVSLNYAKIRNDDFAAYNLFTSSGGLGSGDAGVAAGQDPQQIGLTLTHNF